MDFSEIYGEIVAKTDLVQDRFAMYVLSRIMCWILLFKNVVGSLTRNTAGNLYKRCSVIVNSQLAKEWGKASFICIRKDYDFN